MTKKECDPKNKKASLIDHRCNERSGRWVKMTQKEVTDKLQKCLTKSNRRLEKIQILKRKVKKRSKTVEVEVKSKPKKRITPTQIGPVPTAPAFKVKKRVTPMSVAPVPTAPAFVENRRIVPVVVRATKTTERTVVPTLIVTKPLSERKKVKEREITMRGFKRFKDELLEDYSRTLGGPKTAMAELRYMWFHFLTEEDRIYYRSRKRPTATITKKTPEKEIVFDYYVLAKSDEAKYQNMEDKKMIKTLSSEWNSASVAEKNKYRDNLEYENFFETLYPSVHKKFSEEHKKNISAIVKKTGKKLSQKEENAEHKKLLNRIEDEIRSKWKKMSRAERDKFLYSQEEEEEEEEEQEDEYEADFIDEEEELEGDYAIDPFEFEKKAKKLQKKYEKKQKRKK
jgi:hypothetical protein